VDVPNWVVGCFVPDALFEGRAAPRSTGHRSPGAGLHELP
jgi:hypothetical protein